MTVPELRVECKRLGLPSYQMNGKRLRKAHLIQLIDNVIGNDYPVEPAPPKQKPKSRIPSRKLTDDERLVRQLSVTPATIAETMALYRVLSGTATSRHNRIVRHREGQACKVLSERSKTGKSRLKWHGRYLKSIGGVL